MNINFDPMSLVTGDTQKRLEEKVNEVFASLVKSKAFQKELETLMRDYVLDSVQYMWEDSEKINAYVDSFMMKTLKAKLK